MAKTIWFFQNLNIDLGAHFFFFYFLITSFFESLYFLKWCLIFDTSPFLQFSKFPLGMLIFSQKPLNFVSLPWKLQNQYCHNWKNSKDQNQQKQNTAKLNNGFLVEIFVKGVTEKFFKNSSKNPKPSCFSTRNSWSILEAFDTFGPFWKNLKTFMLWK